MKRLLRMTALFAVLSGLITPASRAAAQQVREGRFVYVDVTSSKPELRSVNPDGSNDVALMALDVPTVDHSDRIVLDLSPDGKRVAFSISSTNNVYIADLEARSTMAVGTGRDPSWTPDGSQIIFAAYRSSANGIVLQTPDGSESSFLPVGWVEHPRLSPDTSTVAYVSARRRLHFVNTDGTGDRLPAPDLVVDDASWSPDGSKISLVAQGTHDDPNVRAYVADRDLTNTRSVYERGLSSRYVRVLDPRWSPDGGRVAFAELEGGFEQEWHLRTFAVDGSDPHVIDTRAWGLSWGTPLAAPPTQPRVTVAPGAVVDRLVGQDVVSLRAALHVVGARVNWSIEGPNGAAQLVCDPIDCVSDGLGVITATYRGNAAGRDAVTACAGDSCSSSRVTWQVPQWRLTPISGPLDQYVGDTYTGRSVAHSRTRLGADLPVDVNVIGANPQQLCASCRTGPDGALHFSWTGTTPGYDTGYACVRGGSCAYAFVHWMDLRSLTVTPARSVIQGAGTHELTVRSTLRGNPVADDPIDVAASGGQVTCSAEQCVTDSNGELVVLVTGAEGEGSATACRHDEASRCATSSLVWNGNVRWVDPTPPDGTVIHVFQGRRADFVLKATDPNAGDHLVIGRPRESGYKCEVPADFGYGTVTMPCWFEPDWTGAKSLTFVAQSGDGSRAEKVIQFVPEDVGIQAAESAAAVAIRDTYTYTVHATDKNGPLAGQPVSVDWTGGVGSVLSRDTVTDQNGDARITVGSDQVGVQRVRIRVAHSCLEGNNDCLELVTTWHPRQHTCDGRGFVALLQGVTTQASIVNNEQLCPPTGQPDVVSYRSINSASAPSGSVERRYGSNGSSAIANVNDAYVGPLRLTIAEATSHSRCDAAGAPSQVLDAGFITIRNGTSVLFEGRPGPNTVVDVPGVARLVLNMQSSTVDPAARTADGVVTAVYAKRANATIARLAEVATSVSCMTP